MDPTVTYRVIRLSVENYKRLKAVDISPPRNAVVVAGKNRQGKTSLLDAIAAVLGGKKQMATQPVRSGQEGGQIICILGDKKPELLVRRVFTASGKTAVEITTNDGFKAPSPQAILDSFCTQVAFDPLQFARMEPKQQAEALRNLVGLDFADADKERATLYAERTQTNREAKVMETRIKAIQFPEDTPDEKVDVSALVEETNRRQAVNRENDKIRSELAIYETNLRGLESQEGVLKAKIADLQAKLVACQAEVSSTKDAVLKMLAMVDAIADQDVEEVSKQIVASQAINESVGRKMAQQELLLRLNDLKSVADALTAKIEGIDASKRETLEKAQWPIEGLGFDDGGVTLNGLPLSQASGAEMLEISFSIAAASNPRLKIALIRDASLLDAEQLEIVKQLAIRYDCQAWLEMVGDSSQGCGVLIEDGEVATEGDAPAGEPKSFDFPSDAADEESERNGTGIPPGDDLDGQQYFQF